MKNKALIRYLTALILLLALCFAFNEAASPVAGVAPTPNAAVSSEEVYVPEGEFLMGCSNDTTSPVVCDLDAQPIHAVYVDAFYIDKTEVTNAQYAACIAAGGCAPPLDANANGQGSLYTIPDLADHPVVFIDRQRAEAYCTWAGQRLPTEAEWEKAARGTDRRLFPWGNELPTCDRTNYVTTYYDEQGNERRRHCVGGTMPVGSYPQNASPYGVLDMVGNAREWVSDFYVRWYYGHTPYYNPTGGTVNDKGSTVRGGSWNDNYDRANTWVRMDEADVAYVEWIGFRCASDATSGSEIPTSTPTPSPTATPSPTVTPFAAIDIDPEGGIVWLADALHLTLLEVRRDDLNATGRITITHAQKDNVQGDLMGINHFFALDADLQGEQTWIPPQFPQPLQLTLGFHESNAIVPGTLDLYRLTEQGWITEGISMSVVGTGYAIADVTWPGVYGLLGSSNHVYLPVIIKR